MGTKQNPGKYDCYANAEPDEPVFVLLGRDFDAPSLVRQWARAREVRGDDPEKIAEARACADAMERYRAVRELRRFVDHVEAVAAGREQPRQGSLRAELECLLDLTGLDYSHLAPDELDEPDGTPDPLLRE